MFSISDKIILFDMSNFTYGIDICIIENGKVISKTKASSKEQAITTVHSLCETSNINNVFIKALAPTNNDKLINEFKLIGKNNFSKTFDKIHYHMI